MSIDAIIAFTEKNKAEMEAATEFARRARKGLPADRFYDGTDGAKVVAKGIDAWIKAFADSVELLRQMEELQRQQGEDAMGLHSADSKYHKG